MEADRRSGVRLETQFLCQQANLHPHYFLAVSPNQLAM
jgi:hypothetical protein